MSLEQIQGMLERLGHFAAEQRKDLELVWHGGEPLLLSPDFYHKVQEIEHQVLDPLGVSFTNSIQTNATVLDEARIELLRDSFDEVGVSIDLFGGQRVDRQGRDANQRILEQMQRLVDAGVHFGCITVLSQANVDRVDDIYSFFEDINVSFRLLPIYRSGYLGQLDEHSLTPTQIVNALRVVADRWFRSLKYIRVEPIHTYMANVVHALESASKPRHYDREHGEAILIIDTDGTVYSNSDAYDVRFAHGNVFHEPLSGMRLSPGFVRALKASRERVARTCNGCEFYGACTGFFAAEATPEQRWPDANGRLLCGVARPLQQYLRQKLDELGLVTVQSRLDITELRNRALEV
jgi:uncharacterized protein